MKKKKSSRKKKWIILLAMVSALVTGIILFFRFTVNPVIIAMSESKVRSLTTKAISDAITSTINENIAYTDLISVYKDAGGNISMLQTNTIRINALARATATKSQFNLEAAGEQGILIPIGTMSGIPLLSGKGFNVKLRVLPIGSIVCDFMSEFTQAGINQTLHKIYIDVHAEVNIIIPGANQKLLTRTEMLVAENLLIGKVPDTYLQSGKLDESLNLIPR